MSEEILNQDKTLEMLGNISLATLYRMIRRGDIVPVVDAPVLRRRRSLRFYKSEVERVIREAEDKEAHSRVVA